MPAEIIPITLPLPYGMGSVNCYLIETTSDFILIDTASTHQRKDLVGKLAQAGCPPDRLSLILLTHGDFDHIGNAAYLRQAMGAKIAMHPKDAGMAEHGDMFWNRKSGNRLFRMLAPLLFRFSESDRFIPNSFLLDGSDLTDYGFPARVISLPGHSLGSIGILTAAGDLFCGDLFTNQDKPKLNSIMDDAEAANASINKLKTWAIRTVYPGHGKPFLMEQFMDEYFFESVPAHHSMT